MKTTSAYPLFIIALLSCAQTASALKFEIPKELQAEAEAQKAAEDDALHHELESLSSDSEAEPSAGDAAAEDDASSQESNPAEQAGEGEAVPVVASDVESQAALASVAGRVFNKETGEPLRGVAVIIEGGELGTVTDVDGRYRINGVAAGTYTLSFVKSGFIESNVTGTELTEDALKRLDFAMMPRPAEMSDELYELQDFTVTAEQVASQNVELLALRQQSVASIDALSSTDMSKFAASDAADALKSVTGVSISGGKYAVVRGLDDRFSTTSLNGIVMPSPDPDRQAVPLDIFPAGLLDNVVTQKSYTPDQPGESSGGAINLTTKTFPETFVLKVSAGLGYNGNATGEGDFLQASEGSFQESPTEFAPKRKAPGLDYSFSANVGGSTKLFGKDLGLIAGISHKKKSTHSSRLKNRYSVDGVNALVESSSIREVSEEEEITSGILGAGIRFSDVTQLSYTGLYSLSNIATGAFERVELESKSDDFYRVDAETMEREYLNHQLVFDHTFDHFLFGLEDVVLNLAGSFSTNTQIEPDTRVSNLLQDGSMAGTYDSADKADPFRYKREMEQENRILKGDLELPVEVSALEELKFKVGGSYEESVRDSKQFEWKGAGFEDRSLAEMGTQNPDIVIIPGVLEFPGSPHFGSSAEIIKTGVSRGTREVKSAYLMSTVRPTSSLQLVGGLRMEQTFLEMVAVEPGRITQFEFNPEVTTSPIDETSWLPALTGTYDISDDIKLRFGVATTVAKPSFRELNPSPIYNTKEGFVEIGNPGTVTNGGFAGGYVLPEDYQGLELVDVRNFDMRVEWYFHDEDMVALSLFRKKLSGPIERVEVAAGGATAFTYFNNENEAEVNGAEFETRFGLGALGDWAEDLYVGGNFTYIDASVARSALERGITPDIADSERPLYNQPASILNAYLGYSNEAHGLDVTLSANRVGEQLFAVTGPGDIYVDPFTSLNLVISKKFFERLTLKFAAKNLLDPKKERSLRSFGTVVPSDTADDEGVANEDTDFGTRDSYQSGRTYSVSASWEF